MADLSQIDPNTTVQMVDRTGNIVPMSAAQAQQELSKPSADYSLATDEQIAEKNSENRYGTTGQKALTTAESLINTGTLGLAKPIVNRAVDVFGGEKTGKAFREAQEARSQENPRSAIIGDVGGIALDPANIFSGISKGGAAIEKATAPVIENVIGKNLVSKAAAKSAGLAAEGATIGAGFEANRQANDDLPYSGEALLDATGRGAMDMLKIALPLHAAVETLGAGINGVKSLAKKNLDKAIGVSEGETVSQIGRNDLKRTPVGDPANPGVSPAVRFAKDENGNLVTKNGKRTVTAPPVTGNGIETYSPDSLNKVGQDLGINDLGFKYNILKLPVESDAQFITEMKKSQMAESWIRQNIDAIPDAERVSFERAQNIIDHVKKVDNLTSQEADLYRQALDENQRIAGEYSKVKVGANGEAIESRPFNEESAEKEVQNYFKKLDYIDDGKNVHVFNTEALPEVMTSIKNIAEEEPLNAEAKGVKRQYNVSEKRIARVGGNEEFNDVAKVILDHYPNQMSKLGDVRTSYDYITKGLKQSLDQAGEKLGDTVERAYNVASDLGLKSGITNQTLANYIEDNILPQYTDRLTGNPLPGQSASYNAIKKIVDEFRDTNWIPNKYGARDYQDISIKDLWKERVRADKLSKWDKDTDAAATNMWKNLRFYVDDKVVSSMKNIPNGESIAQDYLNAKKSWKDLNNANEIAGAAAKKALEKASKGGFSFKGGVIGSAIGGPIGAITGSVLGDPMQFLHNNSGNLQAYFARNMTDSLSSYEQKASSAVNGFFNKTQGKLAPMVKFDVLSSDKIMKRDAARLKQELDNREQFGSNFISLNNTMFDLAPNSSNSMLSTIFRARDFLYSKLPKNPYEGIPYRENQWTPNPQEVSKYLRYREAVEKPSTILDQLRSGYVTPEAIEVLDNVYPATKQYLSEKMLEKVSTQKSIPQEKRVMLYKVFGIPLDAYSAGPLFAQMQANATGMIQQEAENNKPINTSKIGDPMDNPTTGQSTLIAKD